MGVLKALTKILLLTLVLMSVLWLWFSTTMVIGRLSRKRLDFAQSLTSKKSTLVKISWQIQGIIRYNRIGDH